MYIGDNKIGRNDACYCGSEKKYKDCHLKVDFYPKELFFVPVTEIEKINFVNKASEHLRVERVDITYRTTLPWDNEISLILKPLFDEQWNKNDRWEKLIENRKHKIYHKLGILKQHIETFKLLEKSEKIAYRKGIVGNTTMNKIFENPLLILNVEAFLFQAKSALDVFAQLIGHCFKFSITSYGNGGQKLVNILEGKDYEKYRIEADYLIKIIKTNKPWVDKLVNMRDEITHYSDLTGLSCFMFKKIEPTDTQVAVYYPSLSNGERVSKYMDSVWLSTVNLLFECLTTLVKVAKSRRLNL